MVYVYLRTGICLGGTTQFPMAGQSFYDGYSINYPLQQDKTLIALHIYSQSITNGPAINLKVKETVSAYWNHLCANVNITPPPLTKRAIFAPKDTFPLKCDMPLAHAMTINCIPMCRYTLMLNFYAHLNTCQPLTYHSKFHFKKRAIFEQLISGVEGKIQQVSSALIKKYRRSCDLTKINLNHK